ncbi:S-adenosyl-L-methionine-dependent methyltransferase [Chiua virens]|nr:S-adenosyl-L-methionine-dependent methyltransferase [Chiua virens]
MTIPLAEQILTVLYINTPRSYVCEINILHLRISIMSRSNPPNEDTYETANKHHFDAVALQCDNDPKAHKLAEKIGQAMITTGLLKPGITVMDFACGTGLISRVLAATDPKSIVGVDISQAMVDRYNKVVFDHGIPPEEMRAICVSLDANDNSVPDGEQSQSLRGMTFDVIVVRITRFAFCDLFSSYQASSCSQCACAYHHFASIDEVTRTLVTYLNPGGSLLVADLRRAESAHEIFPENVGHIVPHRGAFTEEDIRSTFDKAELNNITFEIITHVRHTGHSVDADLFLARGDK